MCHYRHLHFTDPGVTWRKLEKAGGTTIDTYFVPEDSNVYKFGGPVYAVTFPGEGLIEVMACRRDRCESCKGREVTAATTPAKCFPLVHRAEWMAEKRGNVFRPIESGKYVLPNIEDFTDKVDITFLKSGIDGNEASTIECLTCVEGKCDECE